MNMTRAHAFALGTVLAASAGAVAQTPTPVPAGRITSVTLAATTPTTFRGVCSPFAVSLRGTFRTDIAQTPRKQPGQFIWSDWTVNPSEAETQSGDGKETTVIGRRAFEKSFEGWVKLQADAWTTGRPRESSQLAVKITCESLASKQLQQLPTGPAQIPTPNRGTPIN